MTARDKFKEFFDSFASFDSKREDAYNLAVNQWRIKYDIDPPYNSYESFRQSTNYHYKKHKVK